MDGLLAAQVVLDLQGAVVLDVQVRREEGVNTTHLVLVALGNSNDHVVDDGLDGADCGNLLAVSVHNRDLNLSVVDLDESDVDVSEVVVQSTTGAGDSHLAGLDLDSDVLGDIEDLLLLNETHACCGWF